MFCSVFLIVLKPRLGSVSKELTLRVLDPLAATCLGIQHCWYFINSLLVHRTGTRDRVAKDGTISPGRLIVAFSE